MATAHNPSPQLPPQLPPELPPSYPPPSSGRLAYTPRRQPSRAARVRASATRSTRSCATRAGTPRRSPSETARACASCSTCPHRWAGSGSAGAPRLVRVGVGVGVRVGVGVGAGLRVRTCDRALRPAPRPPLIPNPPPPPLIPTPHHHPSPLLIAYPKVRRAGAALPPWRVSTEHAAAPRRRRRCSGQHRGRGHRRW